MNAKVHRPIAQWFLRSISKPRPAGLLILGIALVLFSVNRIRKAVATTSAHTASMVIERARMSDEISVHAAGLGNPWINLSDGHEVITPYSGPAELTQVLERNQARPLSLCSADFDEDGVPDLISGYAGPSGGIVTLLRGNVDSIYPNAPEAQQRMAEGAFTDAPFLSPAFVFGAPEATDFIGAGDFDGDGRWDVVAAARGSNKLYLMSGDGKGGLQQTKQVDLPGGVTAMVVGEINRRDGLDDVVVGVSGEQGSKVVVFEGPEGALRATPETFELPAEATSLALGQLDESYEIDLAVSAGHELLLVHGRDRMLSLDKERQREVRSARVEQRRFSVGIRSIAVGDFTGNHRTDIALMGADGSLRVLSVGDRFAEDQKVGQLQTIALERWQKEDLASNRSWPEGAQLVCGQVSSVPVDNLVVVDRANRNLEVIAKDKHDVSGQSNSSGTGLLRARLEAGGEMEAVLPMRLNSDALSDLVVLKSQSNAPSVVSTQAVQTFFVTNTNDSGPGSLSDAITKANQNPGADTITFNIQGSTTQTIAPINPLPRIIETVTILGSTTPSRIQLDGLNQNVAPQDAFVVDTPAVNCVIRGLSIYNFRSNDFDRAGIRLYSRGNLVEGNTLGTDFGLSIGLGNMHGVLGIGSANNNVGGSTSAARNLISGNLYTGVLFFGSESESFGNSVKGNLVIKNGTGIQNNSGIYILGGLNNSIGGLASGERNVINQTRTSDGQFGAGITIASPENLLPGTKGTLIQSNYIGVDENGTSALGNNEGINVQAATDTTIGGTTASARNVISGNARFGIWIPGAVNTKVQGNYIGLDASGLFAVPNVFGTQIQDAAALNTIGGVVAGAGNVISGNLAEGVRVVASQATNNSVQGNFIGTNKDGRGAVPNGFSGVFVTQAASTTIGGTDPHARNIISGNSQYGIALGLFEKNPLSGVEDSGGTGVTVRGNYIGTDVTGTQPLGNTLCGIYVEVTSVQHIIENNRIAFNGTNGICIPDVSSADPNLPKIPAVQIRMTNNLIFSNRLLGIDLGPPGVTANPFNRITNGANHLQNFPEISSAVFSSSATSTPLVLAEAAGTITINGRLTATANMTYSIEFNLSGACSPVDGTQTIMSIPLPLGTRSVQTDPTGVASYTFAFPLPAENTISGSGFVNATATSSQSGDTSETSLCASVSGTIPAALSITAACKGDGKQLVVNGSGFVDGAKVLINGEVEKKTTFVSSTQVIAFKAGKRTFTGDTLKVRNPGGLETPGHSYMREDCPP
jgi:hypothetical protein